MPTDRELIELRRIAVPDGIGDYLSEGVEVTVWSNTIDPDYVIKVQKQNLAGYGKSEVQVVNRARWARKKLLYEALSESRSLIATAPTFFLTDGVLWQEYSGVPAATFIASNSDA